MSDSSTPTSNLVSNGSTKHQPAQGGNPSDEQSGRDYLTWNVKRWIVTPVLCFQIFGLGMLTLLFFEFLYGQTDPPALAWPVLIAAFAGIPFGFTVNIKKIMDAVTTNTN